MPAKTVSGLCPDDSQVNGSIAANGRRAISFHDHHKSAAMLRRSRSRLSIAFASFGLNSKFLAINFFLVVVIVALERLDFCLVNGMSELAISVDNRRKSRDAQAMPIDFSHQFQILMQAECLEGKPLEFRDTLSVFSKTFILNAEASNARNPKPMCVIFRLFWQSERSVLAAMTNCRGTRQAHSFCRAD